MWSAPLGTCACKYSRENICQYHVQQRWTPSISTGRKYSKESSANEHRIRFLGNTHSKKVDRNFYTFLSGDDLIEPTPKTIRRMKKNNIRVKMSLATIIAISRQLRRSSDGFSLTKF